MRISNGIIMVWTGTNASIPSGWARETTLDNKFLKGNGAEAPNVTGGSATHSHTSPSHTHAMAANSHYVVLNWGNHGRGSTGEDIVQRDNRQNDSHKHYGYLPISSSSVSSTAVSYAAEANEPPQRKIIYIKASAGALMAQNIVALYNSNTPPTNWTNVTELSGRYLKGASTNADADITSNFGSFTNLHIINHGHTDSHNHYGDYQQPVNLTHGVNSQDGNGQPESNANDAYHGHPTTLSTVNGSITSSVYLVTTETVEPAYAKLQAIKKGVNAILVKGLIGMWLGSVASIPKGWVLCDGTNNTKDLRDKFIKIGNPAEANGGSNTHTHAAQNHTHTASSSHTHTATSINPCSLKRRPAGGGHDYTSNTDNPHSMESCDAQTTSYSNGATTANSSDNQPEYRTVAYIQLDKIITGAAGMLLAFL